MTGYDPTDLTGAMVDSRAFRDDESWVMAVLGGAVKPRVPDFLTARAQRIRPQRPLPGPARAGSLALKGGTGGRPELQQGKTKNSQGLGMTRERNGNEFVISVRHPNLARHLRT
jgi:hypothetical protein